MGHYLQESKCSYLLRTTTAIDDRTELPANDNAGSHHHTRTTKPIIHRTILCTLNLMVFHYLVMFGSGFMAYQPLQVIKCRILFYIYTKNVWFGLINFNDIWTIVGYFRSNPLYTYILNMFMIWFHWVLWHINHCRLFNAKSSLYTYIKYIWYDFVLVRFFGTWTVVGYLMPNLLYTNIYIYIYIYIYNLVWLAFMAYQPF